MIFNNLPFTEKEQILLHWFHYYGKIIYTFEELEIFHKLIKVHADDIFNYIITNYIHTNSIAPTILLNCIRMNKVDDLFKNLIDISKLNQELLDEYTKIADSLYEEINRTYLNPEPSIPMNIGIVISKNNK